MAWGGERFLFCEECDVVFVSSSQVVSRDREKKRYETHNNSLQDTGYRDFLMKTVREISHRFPAGARVLDFGSGPEPALSELLSDAGYHVVSFDPYFSPEPPVGVFDLVLTHEVFEHFREPRAEIEKILSFLKQDGLFLIRSELRPPDFEKWWYARDFTHILFASEKTLFWIAQNFKLEYELWSPVLWAFKRNRP